MNANTTIRYYSPGQAGLLFWKEKRIGSVVIPLIRRPFIVGFKAPCFLPLNSRKQTPNSEYDVT